MRPHSLLSNSGNQTALVKYGRQSQVLSSWKNSSQPSITRTRSEIANGFCNYSVRALNCQPNRSVIRLINNAIIAHESHDTHE
jgi:hypothetical protein